MTNDGSEVTVTVDGGTATQTSAMPATTLMDRTVCLALNRRKFGNSKKAALGSIQTEADKSLLSLSKRLLDSPELKAISVIDRDLMVYLQQVCMPSMFKTGVYLLPIPLVERVEAHLQSVQATRAAAVEAFLSVYPAQIDAIEDRLKNQFNALNYPSVDKMRAAFSLDWQYVTFGVPGSLKAIKASIFEDERVKMAAKMAEAATEYRNTLRARLLTFIEKLAASLKPTEDGKTKRIYESHVDKVAAALQLFDLQDATDDGELKAIVEQARAVMSGIDVSVLRDDDAYRQRIEAGLDDVLKNLQTITIDRSSRTIEFDDDEAAS